MPLLQVVLLASVLAVKCGTAVAECSSAPSIAPASTIQESYWGLHVGSPIYAAWPTVPFATARSWNTWPSVSWSTLNPKYGVYDWTNLSNYVNAVGRRGKDIVYTFGYPPAWAGEPSAQNLGPWTKFVTEIVSRYCNSIKYWELWNEPNSPNSWAGTTAAMVAMAKAAYPIIKSGGGIVVAPAPQGGFGYLWLRDFLSKGGGAYIDVVAIHGYTFRKPENIVPLVEKVRKTMADYGIASKPLWDTEHSWWYGNSGYGDAAVNQSKWLSRFILLQASLGVSRAYWYTWDNPDLGGLFDRARQTLEEPGKAYKNVYRWITGMSIKCAAGALIYSCDVVSPNGGPSRAIYWHSMGWPAKVSVDPKYTKTQNIFGVNGAIRDHRIDISGIPVMVE